MSGDVRGLSPHKTGGPIPFFAAGSSRPSPSAHSTVPDARAGDREEAPVAVPLDPSTSSGMSNSPRDPRAPRGCTRRGPLSVRAIPDTRAGGRAPTW